MNEKFIERVLTVMSRLFVFDSKSENKRFGIEFGICFVFLTFEMRFENNCKKYRLIENGSLFTNHCLMKLFCYFFRLRLRWNSLIHIGGLSCILLLVCDIIIKYFLEFENKLNFTNCLSERPHSIIHQIRNSIA